MVKQIHALVAVLLMALALAGCASTTNGVGLAQSGGPVAFRIGARMVTVGEFQRFLDQELAPVIQNLQAQGQSQEQISQLAAQQNWPDLVLDQMIQEELLLLIARQEGMGINPAAVDAAMEQQQQATRNNLVNPAEMALEDTTSQRVRTAREQLVFEVIARHTTADMFKSRHILVPDAATAEQMVANLAEGQSFAELAREFSQDPGSAAAGGELGWVARGSFVPEFEEAGFSAELNTPTIVQSQFGYHVIVVEDRQNDRPFDDFESLRSNPNAQGFYEETFVPWYEQTRAEAEVQGKLEIKPDFDPNSIPLPFSDDQQ